MCFFFQARPHLFSTYIYTGQKGLRSDAMTLSKSIASSMMSSAPGNSAQSPVNIRKVLSENTCASPMTREYPGGNPNPKYG